MKASPLLISWHNDKSPIYSAHFEPHNSKSRFATAGGDNNIRLWRLERDGENRNVTYLSTLIKVRLDTARVINIALLIQHYSIHKLSMSSDLRLEVRRIAHLSRPTADEIKGRCSLVPVMMAIRSYGCPLKPSLTHRLMERMVLRTKKPGESSTCAARHQAPRYMI